MPPEVLDDCEVRALMTACGITPTGIRNRALIALLYRAGLRIGEALDLEPRDLDLDKGEIRIRHGKGDRSRVVGIDPAGAELVAEWLRKWNRIWSLKGEPPPKQAPVICTMSGGTIAPAYVRPSGRGKQTNRWLLSGVMRCACCGHPFWGLTKRKGKNYGKKQVKKAYYICAGRCKCGAAVCPVSTHVPAESLEDWVLLTVGEAILADGRTVEEAIDQFVTAAMGTEESGIDARAVQAEIDTVDHTVQALLRGLDLANLPLVNDKLTRLRRRREALEKQLRTAKAAAGEVNEKALRAFARERIGLLRDAMAGRRDEKSRQVIASYVREIVIDPREKSGYLVLNEFLEPEQLATCQEPPRSKAKHAAASRPPKRGSKAVQNASDRPKGRSQVGAIVVAQRYLKRELGRVASHGGVRPGRVTDAGGASITPVRWSLMGLTARRCCRSR